MAVKEFLHAPANGDAHAASKDTAKLLAGATISLLNGESDKDLSHVSTQSQPGPIVHSKATTITLYASRDLKVAGLIPEIHDLINHAFGVSHEVSGTFPAENQRLDSHRQLVSELSAPDTFTYVITYAGTETVIGVASAKRYDDTRTLRPASPDDAMSAFMRFGTFGPNSEEWELSLMAVDPSLQRQGLAGVLMNLVEGEVKRRFVLARAEKGQPDLKLVMILTTIKEINWDFYVRKGYQLDYETFHGPGWIGSPTGFHVVHMSKLAEV